MTFDRTKPPPFFEQRYKDSYSFTGDQLYIVDEDGGPCLLTLDTAWDWYDRITLPARVALLRELAAELNAEAYKPEPEHPNREWQLSREAYNEGVKWAAKKCAWKADALEAGK